MTEAVWELTEALQSEKQMESALSSCLEIMKGKVQCEAGFVWVADQDTERLLIIACEGSSDVTGVTIGKNQGIVGHVFDTAEPMLMHAEIPDDSPLYGSDEATGMKVSTQMVTPLRTPGGEPFGCIQLVNKTAGEHLMKRICGWPHS